MTRWLRKIPGAIRSEIWSTDHVLWMGLLCFVCGRQPSKLGAGVLIALGALYVLLIGLMAWRSALTEQIKETPIRTPSRGTR